MKFERSRDRDRDQLARKRNAFRHGKRLKQLNNTLASLFQQAMVEAKNGLGNYEFIVSMKNQAMQKGRLTAPQMYWLRLYANGDPRAMRGPRTNTPRARATSKKLASEILTRPALAADRVLMPKDKGYRPGNPPQQIKQVVIRRRPLANLTSEEVNRAMDRMSKEAKL